MNKRALAVACAALLGCQSRDERDAREHLAGEGLTEVVLTAVADAESSWTYTAMRSGDECKGRIDVAHAGSGKTINDFMSCRPPWTACRADAPVVCFRLGEIRERGDKSTVDPTMKDALAAAEYYKTACAADHARACNALGVKFGEGGGVPQDLPGAVALFDKACRLGSPRGCFNLGVSYHHGKGVASDPARAVPLYKSACERLGSACNNLGVCLRDGIGVDADRRGAMAAFRRGCHEMRAPNAEACLNLGAMEADIETEL